MDIYDRAQEYQMNLNEEAISTFRRTRSIGGNGQTGICIDCNDPIPKRRLEVQPDAVRCIDCQKKHERRV